MRSPIFRGVLVSLSLLPAIGAAAGAPTPVGDVTERAPTAVGVDLGVASALGLGGVTLTRRLASHLRLEGGVGLGITGVQLSFMPKLVFGGERDYFICLPPDGCEPQFFEDVTHYWGPQARAQLAYWF
jgi:hypothetical protein